MLTGDTTDDVVVAAQPGSTVTRLTPRKTWALPANGARQWRVNGLAGGRSQVQFVEGSAAGARGRSSAATRSSPRPGSG